MWYDSELRLNPCKINFQISALTVDCVETYRDAVCKTCDAVDANIKVNRSCFVTHSLIILFFIY